PIAMICCIWIPIYYGFTLIESIVMFSTDPNMLYGWLKLAGIAISCIFYLPFVLQALFVVFLERKKLKCKPAKLILPCLLFPLYMIAYMLSIAIGTFTLKPKWKQITHNVTVDLDSFFSEESQVEAAELQVAADIDESEQEVDMTTEEVSLNEEQTDGLESVEETALEEEGAAVVFDEDSDKVG
ncbi:MAG: hypothetical protein K2N32_05790, partial [Clostridia bacterium]|nr:hypothetical protein [Clostridia bacterium]